MEIKPTTYSRQDLINQFGLIYLRQRLGLEEVAEDADNKN